MATKKRKKRHTTSHSAGPSRRRQRPRRRRGLSEGGKVMGKAKDMVSNTFNVAMNSFAGAGGAIFTNKMVPATSGKLTKVAIALGGGGIAATAGYPNVGVAYAAAMLALTFQNGFMNEDANYASVDALSEGPIYLDENEMPMVMEEGGNFRYLSEGEVMQLAEAGVLELEEDDY